MSKFYYIRKNDKELHDKFGDLKVFVNGKEVTHLFKKFIEKTVQLESK